MKFVIEIVQLFIYLHLGVNNSLLVSRNFICFEGSVAYNLTGNQFPMRTDYKYDEQAAGWVKWHSVPATWGEARLRCYYEGAVLASPINENLAKVMNRMQEENQHGNGIFTGIHSTFSKGDFTSIEGVPLHELFLKQISYNGLSTENCVIMYRPGNVYGVGCSNEYSYICYKMAPKDLQITMCGTDDQEYEYSPTTGSCYKFHRIGRTWSRAFMTCSAEGGHLAIINSDLEAQVIRDIFSKYPENTIMASYTHTASVGFQDWGQRGLWWTIHGQDLSQAGYDKWDQGSPDDKKTQFCGSVNRSGKLNDIWCDGEQNTFPAICEISPVQKLPVY
ncbi:hypothetical protein ABMA28_014648 [Loxostege sticticalis]|uniref:C-type lectin domain-containing protein n=1 Tax=Loxostege sticticalis TaxID=481309 RepID=A0ABD0TBS1_LOXSC